MRYAQIRFEQVSKSYKLGKTDIPALRNVSLEVHKGDFLVIAGPSGSGKTTLLNLIGLIDRPDSGTITLGDTTVSNGAFASASALRRDRLGYVFQTFNLIPVLNVYENVEYPLILQGVEKYRRKELVHQMLKKTGLYSRMKHKPRELSGGQRQRVSIARAVVKNPDIVLADEPTANLDSGTGKEILSLMQELNEEGITFVFSSHDPVIIEKGRRVVKLHDGCIQTIEEREEQQ